MELPKNCLKDCSLRNNIRRQCVSLASLYLDLSTAQKTVKIVENKQ